MKILSEQEQINVLREKCDHAKKRLWIASPFIGTIKDVKSIIGGKWLLPSIDCKILTDIEGGFIREDTFNEFTKNNVEIRSLNSLHAKIYIDDDWCLVTSANLTGTAFQYRFEMGVATEDIEEVKKYFSKWWDLAETITELEKFPLPDAIQTHDGKNFKKKFRFLPYHSEIHDKYEATCEKFYDFAKIYATVTGRNPQMVNDGFTLLQDIDYFFNYLYHEHPNTPTNQIELVRALNDKTKQKEISKYFKGMCEFYKIDPQPFRLEAIRRISIILSPKNIRKLDWQSVEEVVMFFHCYSSYAINRARFLNPQNNKIDAIRKSWSNLLHTGKITHEKIQEAKKTLSFFGDASAYELIMVLSR